MQQEISFKGLAEGQDKPAEDINEEGMENLEPEVVEEPTPEQDQEKEEAGKTEVVRIRKAPKGFIDPLSRRDFVFLINGCAYRVYDVRNRGRRGIRFLGVAEYAGD